MDNSEKPIIQDSKILENEKNASIFEGIGPFFTQTNLILIGLSVFLSAFLTAIVFTISLPLNTKAVIKNLPVITEFSLIKQQLKAALTKIKTIESSLETVKYLEEKLKNSEAKLIVFKGHIYHMMNSLENRIHRQSFPVIQAASPIVFEKQAVNFEHALVMLRDRHQFFNWPLLQAELKNAPSLTTQLEQIDQFLQKPLPVMQKVLDDLIETLKVKQDSTFVEGAADISPKTFFQKCIIYIKKIINLKSISSKNKELSQLLFELQSLKSPSPMVIYPLLTPYKNNEVVASAYETFERYRVFDALMSNLEFSIRQLLLSSSAIEAVK